MTGVQTCALPIFYKHTSLQQTFGIITLAIVAGRPRVLSLLEVIEHFVDFRREVVRRRIEFELRKAEARARGKLLGRGMATCIESTAGSSVDEVELRFAPDGKLTVYCNTKSTGQGHETAFAQVASDALGVPLENIHVIEGDPNVKVQGGGSGGSRSMQFGGSVVLIGSREVIKKGTALAAKEMEAAEADIDFDHGRFRIKGTDRGVALQALVQKFAASLRQFAQIDASFLYFRQGAQSKQLPLHEIGRAHV